MDVDKPLLVALLSTLDLLTLELIVVGAITPMAFFKLVNSDSCRVWYRSYAEKHFLHIFPPGSSTTLTSMSALISDPSWSATCSTSPFQTGTTCFDAVLLQASSVCRLTSYVTATANTKIHCRSIFSWFSHPSIVSIIAPTSSAICISYTCLKVYIAPHQLNYIH